MQFLTTVVASFDAAHRLPDEPGHENNHGHSYRVTVVEEVRFDLTAKRLARAPEQLRTDLESLLIEVNGRDLNEQLFGGSSSLAGVAAWIMERMLMEHPQIITVDVEQVPDLHVVVRKEVRRP